MQKPQIHSNTNTLPEAFLRWPELNPGILLRRYKRFLADVELENGGMVTAHCPNSGSMTGCCEAGRSVYLSFHDNPNRKLKYTWQLIQMPSSMVGVNTLVPNQLVAKAAEAGIIPELSGYDQIRREVTTSKGTRIDLVFERHSWDRCFVEIKNCTMVESGVAMFPDAVTKRGFKHLRELRKLSAEGHRAVIFYLVQRMDAHRFAPADHIDSAYGKELRRAVEDGVQPVVYDVAIDLEKIEINGTLPVHL